MLRSLPVSHRKTPGDVVAPTKKHRVDRPLSTVEDIILRLLHKRGEMRLGDLWKAVAMEPDFISVQPVDYVVRYSASALERIGLLTITPARPEVRAQFPLPGKRAVAADRRHERSTKPAAKSAQGEATR